MVPSVETAAGISENIDSSFRGRLFAIDLTTPGAIDTTVFDREVQAIDHRGLLKWVATRTRIWLFGIGVEHKKIHDMLSGKGENDPIRSAGLYMDLDVGRTFGEYSSILAREGILTKQASDSYKMEVLGPQLGSEFKVVDQMG
jgi:hypothetical protein